ncbi:MAG: hypothetical protein KC587_18720 [Nitrospira sp.]|nr:hypothetical protein [Nitrospira sp.]MCB1664857.1 hypothetical protein [Pseudomonadales bacterium]
MSNSNGDDFASRFKTALREAGFADLNYDEKGKLFGVTAQAVRKWLSGEALPSSRRAPEVAAKLGVRRAWLLDGEAPMRPIATTLAKDVRETANEYNEQFHISSNEFKLLQDFRNLPRPVQLSVEELLGAMSKSLGGP